MSEISFKRFIPIIAVLALALLFIAKLAGPSILRLYVEGGIGTCQKIPILCMAPSSEIINPQIDKEFSRELIPHTFPKLTINVPKGFTVVQETIKKVYYKKKIGKQRQSIIYVLYQVPGFFPNLFPQLKGVGVRDNYEFVKRTMYGQITGIKNIADTFFVIMKSIFTPDLGDQTKVKMAYFLVVDKRGFINYNLSGEENYFDCNVIDNNDGFFKVYIKDKGAALDLAKVLTIISEMKSVD
jgi:hypothetical protein